MLRAQTYLEIFSKKSKKLCFAWNPAWRQERRRQQSVSHCGTQSEGGQGGVEGGGGGGEGGGKGGGGEGEGLHHSTSPVGARRHNKE